MRASNVETNKLEKHITFLATTAAVTPFIGLFGTVLGIISAFQGIGAQGSTSLDVVAPGIADALIATAAGLAAAIPAVYFYNLLSQRVKGLASEMDDFSLEFLNIVERNSPKCRKFNPSTTKKAGIRGAAAERRRRSRKSTSCRWSTSCSCC